mmetsp:Transcript_33276/g.99006  ORF Transcript_33276/g.99006 Transcript_33276/m.99006 type:complete len:353 (-) Transcript_33276:817-1875(-)
MTGGDLRLDAEVVLELATDKVDIDHLTGAETSLLDDVSLVHLGDDSGLRHHVHGSILGDRITSGTKAVTIEGGADGLSVGEDEEGGTIPRLKESSVEAVEVNDLRVVLEGRLVLIGRGDESHEGAGGTVAGDAHELEDRIEVGRIGPSQINERLQNVREVLGVAHGHDVLGVLIVDQIIQGILPLTLRNFETLGLLAGADPVHIPEEGVDLAVVPDYAHGLGEGPAGIGVGREATVVDHELGGVTLIGQVLVELGQDTRLDHALVHDGAGREGSNVCLTGGIVPDESALLQFSAEPTADEVEGTLEAIPLVVIIGEAFGGLDEELPHGGDSISGQGAQYRGINRHLPPPNKV